MRANAPAAEGKRLQNKRKRGVHATEQSKKRKAMCLEEIVFLYLSFLNVTCHWVLWSSATTTALSENIGEEGTQIQML